MVSVSELQADVNGLINGRGQIIRIKYYTQSITGGGSYYDDSVTYTQSGSNLWTSGLPQGVGGRRGSKEAELIEEGKLLSSDIRLYIAGSHSTSGAGIVIGLGSPPVSEYRIVEEGMDGYNLMGGTIYKKVYCRILPNGSLF